MENELCEKLYRTYYAKVYSYLVTLARDRELAEELTQETFYRAFMSTSSYRGESGEGTWLCAIAKNLFADEMRKRNRIAELEEADSGIDIEKDAADRDQSLRIHIALHRLDEPYREVFELRVFGELSFKEIGSVFQKTESWARVTYFRAKKQIVERLE